MVKTLTQRYTAIWDVIELCSSFCGANVMNPEYRMSWLTYGLVVVINVFLSATSYTTYTTYTKDRDWTTMLQSLTTFGGGVLGYCKFINALLKCKRVQFATSLLKDIYAEYETKDSVYFLCLNKNIQRVKTTIKVIAAVYVGVQLAFSLTPVYFYFVHKKRLLILQFGLPGADPTTNIGYTVLIITHLTCLFFGTFGNFAGDAIFFTTVCSIPMLKDIMIIKFQNLNKLLTDDQNDEVEKEEIRKAFKDILQWHQTYLELLEATKDQGYWIVLAQIFCNGGSIIVTLFCLILGTWPGGEAYLIYCVVCLYIYCALGTMLQTTNEDIIDGCYFEVKWYKLAVQEQKMLLVMIRMSQATTSLDIAGTTPLTVNVAVKVTKLVYTMTMMLINFLDEV